MQDVVQGLREDESTIVQLKLEIKFTFPIELD